MNNKEILIISHEFPPFGGGAGVVAYQYCLELQSQNYNVSLLTQYQANFSNKLQNINIITVKYIPKFWFLPYRFVLKSLDLKQFDTIILNDITSGYVAGKYFKDEILFKCIPILHGSEPENIYNNISLWFKIIRFKKYYTNMINKSKKIVAVSNYMKEKFVEETPFNDDTKIKVCYAGLNDSFMQQREDVDCDKIYNYPNKEIILTVSRIEKQKGFFDMYQVFKKLIAKDDSFIWIIIGDGTYKQKLEFIVKDDNLSDKVIFQSKVTRNKLYKYYKCADVFWLMSKYKESFGLVYLEAQSCGTPAIGYNKYGVKEAIADGKTGFLVDSADESLEIFFKRKYKRLDQADIINFINLFVMDFKWLI